MRWRVHRRSRRAAGTGWSAGGGDDALVWSAEGSRFVAGGAARVVSSLTILAVIVAVLLLLVALGGGSDAPGRFIAVGCILAGTGLLWLAVWVADRRLVTGIRLAPADRPVAVILHRVDGSTVSHPLKSLTGVTVHWTVLFETAPAAVHDGDAVQTVHLAGRRFTCRAAPVPPEWRAAVAALGVPVRTEVRRLPEVDRDVGP